jgi:glycosyltransferase involved in cell wall biosynthesis
MTSLLTPLNEILFYHRRGDLIAPPADLVSVVIASYNYANYVVETLDSVVSQTLPHIELIVVDDCSKDGSVRVIREWMLEHADRFARSVLATPSENFGLAQTRNSAISLSFGQKIFVLDSDNIIVPRALQRHSEVMDRTGAQAVYSQFEWFGSEARLGVADFWDVEKMRKGNYIDAMAMIARSAWEEVGGYSYFDVMGWEDYDLWLKFIEKDFRGVFIPEVLCRYRVHPGSMQHMETSPKGLRLANEIMSLHPWLDLPI